VDPRVITIRPPSKTHDFLSLYKLGRLVFTVSISKFALILCRVPLLRKELSAFFTLREFSRRTDERLPAYKSSI
jgi:hypothetical protein